MATLLKCKMCGGDIEVSRDMTIGTCRYCGSTMTLPRIDTDKKARLFNRANEYRINCEFDKAYDAYKTIAEEDEQEAEAYWGMLLSEYGVEYVEDPNSHKRVPTCHRTLVKPIQAQVNYELACKYADSENRLLYRDEAENLDKIQKKILSVSSKEEPYDVFICYKETDAETGERTEDSVIAQEIYTELVRQGVKTFFSRITLADKLGQDYEPYIFSALKSARIMLIVGTSNSNMSAVWVKNEWSRFLSFMQEDTSKLIIPVIKGMETYELPFELTRFQGQDYSKIGALQDISHSVLKIINVEINHQKDSEIDDLIREKKERERRNAEKIIKRAKTRKKLIVVLAAIFALSAIVFVLYNLETRYWSFNRVYKRADKHLEKCEFDEAITLYESIPDFKDSQYRIMEANYQKAITLLDHGNYYDAMQAFLLYPSYKDSISYQTICKDELLKDLSVGDHFYFGVLDQVGGENRPIEWIVIDNNETEITAISRYSLGKEENLSNYSWSRCINKWMEKFKKLAFDDNELSRINSLGLPKRGIVQSSKEEDWCRPVKLIGKNDDFSYGYDKDNPWYVLDFDNKKMMYMNAEGEVDSSAKGTAFIRPVITIQR